MQFGKVLGDVDLEDPQTTTTGPMWESDRQRPGDVAPIAPRVQGYR